MEGEIGRTAPGRAMFDVVISLYQRDGHGPDDHVEHRFVDLPDAPLTSDQLEVVYRRAPTGPGTWPR